jgi:DeoR/GlpR family transcriptional regulator of sugar metabolism
MTIRRDLTQLEADGLCRRTRGGAVAIRSALVRELHYSQREALHVAEKVAIGRAAADMVTDGDTVFIDTGTTTVHMAAALKERRNITVITNSLRVLDQLCESAGITLISTGGAVTPVLDGALGHGDHFLVGHLAEATLRRFRPAKAFMGTPGVTIADGLSTAVLEQTESSRLAMELSGEVILLADSSKFGSVAVSIIGPINLLDRVITDSGMPVEMRHALQEVGLAVTIVEPASDIPWATKRPVIAPEGPASG